MHKSKDVIMKKKCLIVGGSGFIGSSLVKCFAQNDYDVTVYDIADNPFREFGNKINYVKGNCFCDEIDDKLFEDQEFVILLACSVSPKSSMEKPELCYEQDIIMMIKVLEKMKNGRIPRLVFVSSGGTVYGDHGAELLDENMQTFPINHYGIMKLTQEKILIMYNQLYGMKNVIFRMANPYGPNQKISSGVGAITSFINCIINEKPIYIYGDDQIIRDYIYIDDAAQIIYQFLQKDIAEDIQPIYNVGTGRGSSLRDIIEVIENITGKKAKIEVLEKRKIDVKYNVLKMDKMFQIIGEYRCLPIDEGIAKYLKLF